ncbi:hypothetical protein ACOME3_010040 [Neoechinorhynchus agilis]
MKLCMKALDDNAYITVKFAFTCRPCDSDINKYLELHIISETDCIVLIPQFGDVVSQSWCKHIRNILNSQIVVKQHGFFWFPLTSFNFCTYDEYVQTMSDDQQKKCVQSIISEPRLHFVIVQRMMDGRSFIRVNKVDQIDEVAVVESSDSNQPLNDNFHSCQITIPVEDINSAFMSPITFEVELSKNKSTTFKFYMICIQRRKHHFELFTDDPNVAILWTNVLNEGAKLKYDRWESSTSRPTLDQVTWNQVLHNDTELSEVLHAIAHSDFSKNQIRVFPQNEKKNRSIGSQNQKTVPPQDHAIPMTVDKLISKLNNQMSAVGIKQILEYSKLVAKTADRIAGDKPPLAKMKKKIMRSRQTAMRNGLSSSSSSSSSTSSSTEDLTSPFNFLQLETPPNRKKSKTQQAMKDFALEIANISSNRPFSGKKD